MEYRLARVALAPAALEDCLCALRFLNNNAKTYFIDTSPIVVSGESGDAVDGEPAEPGGTGAEGVAVDVCARGLAAGVDRLRAENTAGSHRASGREYSLPSASF